MPADENTNRASAQAHSGDVAADSADAAQKKRRSPRDGAVKNGAAKNGADINGAAKNGAANNGAEDRTNLSPTQLAEAVQGNQDIDQPS